MTSKQAWKPRSQMATTMTTTAFDTGSREPVAMPAAFTCDQTKRRTDTQDRHAYEVREKRNKQRIEESEQKRIANALNRTSEIEYPPLGSTRVSATPALNYRAATGVASVATATISSLFPVSLPPPPSTAHAPQPRPAFTYSRAAYAGKEEDDADPPEEGEEEGDGEEGEEDEELNSDISGGRRWGGKNSLY